MLRIDRLGRIGDDAAWLCRVPRQPKSCSCVRPARSQGKITLPASLELHGSFDPKRGLYAGQHGVLESPSPRTLRWTVNLALSSSCSGRGVRTSATSAQQMCFHPPPPPPGSYFTRCRGSLAPSSAADDHACHRTSHHRYGRPRNDTNATRELLRSSHRERRFSNRVHMVRGSPRARKPNGSPTHQYWRRC
jgi:hypothetical protein